MFARTNESEIEQDDSRHWQQKTKKILQSQDYSHLRLNGGKHHGRPAQTSPTNWKCAKVVSDTAKNSEKSVLCQAATRGSLTLQHTATHCNTLQHTATHCNTLQRTETHYNALKYAGTHCNTLQHTAAQKIVNVCVCHTHTQMLQHT